MITSKELRRKWLEFYVKNGHYDCGVVSLVSDGSTGAMFTVAGMQPIMPYLLGEKYPNGATRIVNVQGCIRTVDIEEVGDNRHCTFFEMMGAWSLGDYWKDERCAYSWQLLTDVFGLDKNRLACTVFEGDANAPRDDETAKYRMQYGFPKNKVFYLNKKENWWELDRGPCGPCSELFYETDKPKCGKGCNPSCDCGAYVEIGNDVFMQFNRVEDSKYIPLENKNIDTGWGFERNLMFLQGTSDVFKTDLFSEAIKVIERLSGKKYEENKKAFRVIADHTRTAVMLIGDVNSLLPSNTAQGYILRRLIRRAVRYARGLGLIAGALSVVAKTFFDVYGEAYPLLVKNTDYILDQINKEEERFLKTLEGGEREFIKLVERIKKFAPNNTVISGKEAFKLFDTYGFPLELTQEMAREFLFTVDDKGFNKAFAEHREKSQTANAGAFKGGLVENNDITTKLHTATHLLLAALRKVVKDDITQKGSHITPERLRFDFNSEKLTDAQVKKVEDLINTWIKKALPIVCKEMPIEQAFASGALGVFGTKYGDVVKVYSIGDVSCELCGGPHAENTKDLGTFKIAKEESVAAGIRRIKAIIS
ncbi:MAG: alanine--tRNA ligase [Firmicutes bacterium]|nr:alanine--tRNA ligase [Bacillota bacterium]